MALSSSSVILATRTASGGDLLTRSLRSKSVANAILTKARLLAIAHFNHFLFQSLAFGDVLGDAGNAIYFAQFVANRKCPVMNPMDDPLGRDDSILFVIFPGDLPGQRRFGDAVAVFSMNCL